MKDVLRRIPYKNPAAIYRVVDGMAHIMCIEFENKIRTEFAFNEISTSIWELINGQSNGLAIARKLTKIYDVKYDKATEEVARFLKKILKDELVLFKEEK